MFKLISASPMRPLAPVITMRVILLEDAALLLPGESLVARAREARALLIEIDLVANK